MIKFAVLCPSEIAYRRFMPALKLVENVDFVGVGVSSSNERLRGDNRTDAEVELIINNSIQKANKFVECFGGRVFNSYQEVLTEESIDAVYIPLPPALHFQWAKKALEHGKHVLVEKPAVLSRIEAKGLVDIADRNSLVLHENYMFVYHNQLSEIKRIVESGEIGEVRLYRIAFGFPKREKKDFRYKHELGGGALIDACGYALKYASMLLGANLQIRYAQMNYVSEHEVDIFGSGALSNDKEEILQFAYGMDNEYKCEIEIWGSKGCLKSGRIFTAPVGFTPTVEITKAGVKEVMPLQADDTFKKSIESFVDAIADDGNRKRKYTEIVHQANLVEQFRKLAKR